MMDGTQPQENNRQPLTVDVANLVKQTKAIRAHLEQLQHQRLEPNTNSHPAPEPNSLHELQITMEHLHMADEELRQQRDELLETRLRVEQERQRYYDLFEFAPDGYLVTDKHGVIHEANLAASVLLNRHRRFLIGKPLSVLIAANDKRDFLVWLNKAATSYAVTEWEGKLQPTRKEQAIDVSFRTSIARSSYGDEVQLLWQIRDITELKQRNAELEALNKRLLEVQETEKRALARELHDEIGQTLTGLKMMLSSSEDSRTVAALDIVSGLIEQVREMSLQLRPSILDDLGLIPALQWFFDRYTMQTNISVVFDCSGIITRLPSAIETAAYRIIQESLTNVARHAQTKEVQVQVQVLKHILHLQIEDHGVGFNPEEALLSASSGLSGMKERATMLGGEFHIAAARQRGSSIRVIIPVVPKDSI